MKQNSDNLRCYHSVCQLEMRKSKKLSQDSQSLDGDFKPGPPERTTSFTLLCMLLYANYLIKLWIQKK
jgi:hypothetical protein